DILLRGIGVGHVQEVRNGDEALTALSEQSFDVVVADAAMAPVGAIELTRRIRKGLPGISPYLPVVMMSAHASLEEIVTARDAGVNEYLAKPLSAKLLDLRLRSVVKHPRPFVRSDQFFGPDRRRHEDSRFDGGERRHQDPDLIHQD
ncbi:MAG: response regulator, partial [Alphaproteobacteria bacterium]|nr:response regulator [Alphaproteobacteria bacterium]